MAAPIFLKSAFPASFVSNLSSQQSLCAPLHIPSCHKPRHGFAPPQPVKVRAMAKKGKRAGAGTAQKDRTGSKTPGDSSNSPSTTGRGRAYEYETKRIILSVSHLRKVTQTGREILKNINIGMYLGAKIGILGSNGAGKSTLLKILAGVDTDFDGDLYLEPGIQIGYLPQGCTRGRGSTLLARREHTAATQNM